MVEEILHETEASPGRRGWCPGAWRPMASADGLVARLRPSGGRLSGAQLLTMASAASHAGNGVIELTGRANLQLRGIEAAKLAALQAQLGLAGLLDSSAADEARRNILLPPLAGLDPTAALDLLPLLAELEHRLREADELAALPAKFALVLEDGGLFQPSRITADLRARPVAQLPGQLAVGVGAPDGGTRWLGSAPPTLLPGILLALMRRSLPYLETLPRARFSYLTTDNCRAIAQGLPLRPLGSTPMPEPPGGSAPPLGHWRLGELSLVGVAAPLGRLDPRMLEILAGCIGPNGQARLTPWRSFVLPDQSAPILRTLKDGGFIVDASSPLLAIAACPGKEGCRSGTTSTLKDALHLAARLPLEPGGGIRLHVAGCAKGCAHPAKSALTLVGRNGSYDLVQDGRADASPLAKGLSLGDAAHLLSSLTLRTDRP
ncbi:precorrin-3B synthase [Arboricoccus pini]|nr:precorrin-3B synthase [Arboricoccus pini]